jgi:hypothetical protein
VARARAKKAVLSTADARMSADARKWKKELQLAGKREKDYREAGEKIIKRYRGEEEKRNRFNVLWTNTEILRPSIYNSRPNPDVRRRFRDADPLGKAIAELLERSLSVFLDGDETDYALKNDVLDGLLPGRGISRIRYVPKISEAPDTDGPDTDSEDESSPAPSSADDDDKETPEGDEEPEEMLEGEEVCIEHVDWLDFRMGYGRVWAEVPCVFFRCKLTRAEAEEKFGKKAIAGLKFAVPTIEDKSRGADEQAGETQKVAEFWETWDKEGDRVFFIQDDLDHLLFPLDNPEGEPPIRFHGFFPCPKPFEPVENTSSTIPIPVFRLYQEQANQLDKISGRIDKIVDTMRLRGVYDARIPELADIFSSDDNEMVPIQNAQQWSQAGLDKAVSWMPVEKNVEILQGLYDARERQKAIIDELLGISDIIRGATDPGETATAQQIKSTFGSMRLQRMQKEVQRYARDILRLAADAMAQKFSPETFEAMTELKFPTAQEKQALIARFQQQAMAQQAQPPAPAQAGPAPGMPPGAPQGAPGPAPMPPPGPPIDPALLKMPTWEDIIALLRSEKMRQYKIDVETDSTISASLSSDMAGLATVLQAVSQTMTELAPMVGEGVLPVDSAKELVMAVIRRARLGNVVEDAFDKMQPPKPKPDPEQQKAQSQMAQAQAKGQVELQIAEQKAKLDAWVAQQEQLAQERQNQQEQAMEAQRTAHKEAFDTMQAKLDAMVKIVVATIGATKQADPIVQPIADQTLASVQ